MSAICTVNTDYPKRTDPPFSLFFYCQTQILSSVSPVRVFRQAGQKQPGDGFPGKGQSMRKFRIGILGCGVISNTYISDIGHFYRDLTIAACADVIPEAAIAQAEKFGIEKACSPEELLADDSLDIIVNLTPPAFHTALNRQIIDAGKHLFCEKPFAPTLREAEEVLALAEAKGVMVGCAPDTFLSSGLQSMRFYLDAGLIGEPFFVTANMTTFGHETWHPNPLPFYAESAGPMFDMAPYYLSAIISLLGPVESVASFGATPHKTRHIYTGQKAGEDFEVHIPTHYSSILRLRSGVICSMNMSFDIYHSDLPALEICGSDGTLSYPDPNFGGGCPKVYRKEQYTGTILQQTEEAQSRRGKFYELPELYTRVADYSRGLGVLELADAIDTGRKNRAGGELIRHVTEVIEAVCNSAADGHLYTMKTTCERPLPIPPGVQADRFC